MELSELGDLKRLTPPQRLELISLLWESLEDQDVPFAAAQRAELDRRFDTFQEDCKQGRSWQELKAEMERRCP